MRDNEPLSSLTAFTGFLLSIIGLVLLIALASQYGRVRHTVGFSVFGSGLILLYLVSAIYHFLPKNKRAKEVFRVLDHAMIYVLIASTYTPITLLIPQRGWGWSLFGIIWGLACVGIILKIAIKNEQTWFVPLPYIAMGWLGIIALPVLHKSLPWIGLRWLLLGGILYTFGVIFFIKGSLPQRKRWFGMHEAFHLFVIGGSLSHFWFMIRYLLYV